MTFLTFNKFLALLFIVAILPTTELHSKNVELKWKAAIGAFGYIIQLKNSSNKIFKEIQTQNNKVNIELPPGDYYWRIASINKFKKHGDWSDWNLLRIGNTISSNENNHSITNTISKDIEKTADISKLSPVVLEISFKDRMLLIRGQNIDTQTRYSIIGPDNDEINTRMHARGSGFMWIQILEKELGQGQYKAVLVNTGNPSTITNAFLILEPNNKHVTELNAGNLWQLLIPGLPQFIRGDYGKGSTYFLLSLGLTGAAISENSQANAISIDKNNDIFYNIYNNPFWILALGDNLPNNTMLGLWQYSQGKKMTNEYEKHISRRNVYSGAAGAMFIFHLIDAIFYKNQSTDMKTVFKYSGIKTQTFLNLESSEMIHTAFTTFYF